jgi:hypothetical protein
MTLGPDAIQASFTPAGDGTGDYIAGPVPGPGKRTAPGIVAAAVLAARDGLISISDSHRAALQVLAGAGGPAGARVLAGQAVALALAADQVLGASDAGLLAPREAAWGTSHQLPHDDRELVAHLIDTILTHSPGVIAWPFTSRPFHPKSWCGGRPPLTGTGPARSSGPSQRRPRRATPPRHQR